MSIFFRSVAVKHPVKREKGVLEKGLTSDEMLGKEEKTCVNQIALGKRGKERKAGIEGFK